MANNFKNALVENQTWLDGLTEKEFWSVVNKEAPLAEASFITRFVPPPKNVPVEMIIYLAASFLLTTKALPRNLAIALKLLQKCLEFNDGNVQLYQSMGQGIVKESLEQAKEKAETAVLTQQA
ncbi:MAG: hypothetical protein LKF34_03675 [Acidaminococcaceae bacterium]|jgi:hypothetical protein|nr:hypothetical protein [Acidaminococcaceae bacterium]